MHTTVRTIPFDVEAVAAWWERPGALTRLTPPWTALEPQEDAGDLRAGTARFTLAGLPLESRHLPEEYRAGRAFADRVHLAGVPAPWRHVHRVQPHVGRHRGGVGPAADLIDEVRAPVGAAGLERAASYRSRQLSGDLDVHARMARLRGTADPLTVGITGASGTVGTALGALLTSGGHRVVRLVRGEAHGPDQRRWDPEDPAADLAVGLDAIVHLAGVPIAGRFTPEHKAAVRESRVDPTARLAAVAGDAVFVSASAIGHYGADRGDEVLDESAAPGDDDLAHVVRDWEAAAARAAGRHVCVRTGIVQSARGGTLALQYPLFLAGLGGRLGSGRQWLSWIGIDDLLDVYYRAIVDDRLSGPVNAVSPHPARQEDWARTLGTVLRRPTLVPTLLAGPRLLLGEEGVRLLALADQRVDPAALRAVGHPFRFPHLAGALGHELGRSGRTVVTATGRPGGE